MAHKKPEKITGKESENVSPNPPQNSGKDPRQIFQKLSAVHDAFFRTFLQSSIPIVLSTLQDGRFINVSDAFLKITGFSREEIIGRTSTETGILTKETRSYFEKEMNTNDYISNLEIDIRTKSGLSRHGLLNSAKVILGDETFLI